MTTDPLADALIVARAWRLDEPGALGRVCEHRQVHPDYQQAVALWLGRRLDVTGHRCCPERCCEQSRLPYVAALSSRRTARGENRD